MQSVFFKKLLKIIVYISYTLKVKMTMKGRKIPMRLRNIPGAKDAIEESNYVVHNVQEKNGEMAGSFRQ